MEDGRVLCARRGPPQRHPGLWELPGGKVEPGESDAQALQRELEDELRVSVHVAEYIGTSAHDYPDLKIDLVAYVCQITRGQPEPVEHAELRWVALSALEALSWAPADQPLIALLSASAACT